MLKIRLFIDFWNFSLSLRDHSREYRIDWTELSIFLTKQCGEIIGADTAYDTSYVFASVDNRNPKERNLREFLENTMKRFPGYRVRIKPRKPAGGVRCPICQHEIDICPHCKQKLKRTTEKGIDADIITELITQGIDGYYDVACLLSDDSDFAPAVRYLSNNKGLKIFHCGVGKMGQELSKASWGRIDLAPHLPKIRRTHSH